MSRPQTQGRTAKVIAPYRGDIWTATLDPIKGHEQGGTRPCLILSANRFNHGRAELVVIVPITTKDKRIPSHVKVRKGEAGLREESFIKCEEVRCISKDRLTQQHGSVEPATMAAVEQWVRVILQL